MQTQEEPTNRHQEEKRWQTDGEKRKTMRELTWDWLTHDTQVCTENEREDDKDGKSKANMTHEERNKIMQEITEHRKPENHDHDVPACKLKQLESLKYTKHSD